MPEPPLNTPFDAALLALSGGMLDAFTYLNHGGVFACAMTGNAVLCAIALLAHDITQAIRHIVPGIAFLAGATLSHLVIARLGRRAALAGLSFEILSLFVASLLPTTFPNMAFTALIAFVASFQVCSFRSVDTFSYNSTFITGNLRSLGDGFFASLSSLPEQRAQGRRQLRDLSLIIGGFLVGALSGATLAPRLANHTLWFALLPLLAVLLKTDLDEKRLNRA